MFRILANNVWNLSPLYKTVSVYPMTRTRRPLTLKECYSEKLLWCVVTLVMVLMVLTSTISKTQLEIELSEDLVNL